MSLVTNGFVQQGMGLNLFLYISAMVPLQRHGDQGSNESYMIKKFTKRMFCTIYCKHWFNKHYSINVSKKLSKKQTGNLLFYTNPVVSFTKIDLLGLCLQLPQFLDFSEKKFSI